MMRICTAAADRIEVNLQLFISYGFLPNKYCLNTVTSTVFTPLAKAIKSTPSLKLTREGLIHKIAKIDFEYSTSMSKIERKV